MPTFTISSPKEPRSEVSSAPVTWDTSAKEYPGLGKRKHVSYASPLNEAASGFTGSLLNETPPYIQEQDKDTQDARLLITAILDLKFHLGSVRQTALD